MEIKTVCRGLPIFCGNFEARFAGKCRRNMGLKSLFEARIRLRGARSGSLAFSDDLQLDENVFFPFKNEIPSSS